MASDWQVSATVHTATAQPGDPGAYSGADSFTFVLLRLRDPDGVEGVGVTGRFLAIEVAHLLNRACPDLLAASSGNAVADFSRQYNPRGMGGVAVSARSALDIALTDIEAKRAGISVANHLGGARQAAPVHITCGFPELDTRALADTCAGEVAAGARGVKVLIAARGRSVAEDLTRLKAVRSAIGPKAELIADANCKMSTADALDLIRGAGALDLTWLEEPIAANDRKGLADLARHGVPLGAGQMEQSADRFALLAEAGVQVIQPNAVFAGGFDQAIAAGRAASAQGAAVSPAGGWDIVNLHWMCGAFEMGAIELHRAQARIVRLLMPEGLSVSNGELAVPEVPGLGLQPDDAALDACRIG